MAEFDIPQANILKSLQALHNGLCHLSCLLVSLSPCLLKECYRLRDGHVEDIIDVLPTEGYIKDFLLEAVSVTSLTLKNEVGHELHLYCDKTCTLAFLTASPLSIKGEILWCESHLLGQWLCGI